MRILFILLMLSLPVSAQTFTPVPYTFVPNTAVIPSQLMSNFASIIASGNAVAANLNSKITALSAIPSGALVFFNLNSCPSGWTITASPNNTLFIRGLDNGAGFDPTGTLLGATETGVMQNHTHNTTGIISSPPVTKSLFTLGSGVNFQTDVSGFGVNLPTGNPSTGNHGSEVRPANVSLLLCSKN